MSISSLNRSAQVASKALQGWLHPQDAAKASKASTPFAWVRRTKDQKDADANKQEQAKAPYRSLFSKVESFGLMELLKSLFLSWRSTKEATVQIVLERENGQQSISVHKKGTWEANQKGKEFITSTLKSDLAKSEIRAESIATLPSELERNDFFLKIGNDKRKITSERDLNEAIVHWLPAKVRSNDTLRKQAVDDVKALLQQGAMARIIVGAKDFGATFDDSKFAVGATNIVTNKGKGRVAYTLSYGSNLGRFSIAMEIKNDECEMPHLNGKSLGFEASVEPIVLQKQPGLEATATVGLNTEIDIAISMRRDEGEPSKPERIECKLECTRADGNWEFEDQQSQP